MEEESKDFESTPVTSKASCNLLPKNVKTSYDLVKNISLPHYSPSTLSVNMPLSRSSSCRNYHKVTWQKSYSSESLKMNAYQYSISGVSVRKMLSLSCAKTASHFRVQSPMNHTLIPRALCAVNYLNLLPLYSRLRYLYFLLKDSCIFCIQWYTIM